jgi:glc operon protein GlcG
MQKALLLAAASLPLVFGAPGRLPGDNPPPRAMLLKPPPVPTPAHPAPDMRNKAPGPSFAESLAVARAALAACTARGQRVGVAVVDSSGQPRVALVADGALGGHIYTAVRKGLAALAFKEPTSQVSAQLQSGRIRASQITADMVPWSGAVPLWRGDRLIGAVAVSGSVSEEDEACARAGAAKMRRK